jgi:hypothetical protein
MSVILNLPPLFSIEYADGSRVLGSRCAATITLPDGRSGDIILAEEWDLRLEWRYATPPQAKHFLDSPCAYCGREACIGGDDLLDVGKLKFMCMPCSIEHDRYVAKHSPPNHSSLSKEEQLASLRRFDEQLVEHMKQWLSKRNPK